MKNQKKKKKGRTKLQDFGENEEKKRKEERTN